MRRAPKQHPTEDALYAAAIGALTRRPHSVYEMRKWLEQRTTQKEHVSAALARLKERGYLDDARYAKQFARTRVESRRLGRFRVARDLRARGVPDRHIETALDEIFAANDQAAMLRRHIERKLRSLRRRPAADDSEPPSPDTRNATGLDRKQLASLYSSLLRAGFPSDLIRRELRAIGKHADSLPEDEPFATTDEPR